MLISSFLWPPVSRKTDGRGCSKEKTCRGTGKAFRHLTGRQPVDSAALAPIRGTCPGWGSLSETEMEPAFSSGAKPTLSQPMQGVGILGPS